MLILYQTYVAGIASMLYRRDLSVLKRRASVKNYNAVKSNAYIVSNSYTNPVVLIQQ
jgi:hypothetical protein